MKREEEKKETYLTVESTIVHREELSLVPNGVAEENALHPPVDRMNYAGSNQSNTFLIMYDAYNRRSGRRAKCQNQDRRQRSRRTINKAGIFIYIRTSNLHAHMKNPQPHECV